MIAKNEAEPNRAPSFSLKALFKKMGMSALLRQCRFRKRSGASCEELLLAALTVVLSGHRNVWEFFEGRASKGCAASRDALYRFLKRGECNWDRLLLKMAVFTSRFLCSLAGPDEKPAGVLIVDDTPIERPRAKKCQCAFRLHSHVTGSKFKGMLQESLGWSDGISYVPVADAITGSRKPELAVARQVPPRDGRTASARARREMTGSTKPEILKERARQALAAGIKAQYLLADSWYCSDELFSNMRELGLGVITMAKSTVLFSDRKGGMRMRQSELRGIAARRAGGSGSSALSMIAFTKGGARVRLVFVSKRNSQDEFITLACTDCELPAEEIVKLYARRWMIEVRFKAQKQWLGLGTECQGHLFETVHSQMIISSMRYMLLELNRRIEKDPRSFCACCRAVREECRELSYAEALKTLAAMITSLPEKLLDKKIVTRRQAGLIAEAISDMLEEWFSSTLDYIKGFMERSIDRARKSMSHFKEPAGC